MRRARHILFAGILLIPLGALSWLGLTESGLRRAVQYAEPYLPGQIKMSKLEGRLMGTISIKGLEYTQAGALIKAEQLTLNWLPATLLTSSVDISRLHVRSLRIDLPQTKKTDQPLTLPDINLPWRVTVKDVLVDGFQLKQNKQTFALEQIRLDASSLISQLDIDELSIRSGNFSLTVEGEIQLADNYPHKLDVRWQTKLPSNAVIKGNGQLVGNLAMTQVQQHLSGPLQLSLDAKLNNLLDQFNWQATANITAFEAKKLAAGWPVVLGKSTLTGSGDLTTAALSGTLSGQYPELGPFDANFELQRVEENRFLLDRLSLNAPNRDSFLYASGEWLPGKDGGNVALVMSWQNVRWPLKDGAWFDSAIGSGWIEGNIHQYRAGLATDRPWPQAPPSFWYASADGNLDGLNFHTLRITALNGEALARGQLNWTPQLIWNAQATASRINPSQFVPLGAKWAGQLNTTLTSQGRYEEGQLKVDADVTQLSGNLRGYPVSLRSRFAWRNAGLDIHLLDFSSGQNQINAQGRIGETLKLDWSIAATNLSELYPQAQGKLNATGLLTGPRSAPGIQATVKGESLSLPDYTVGRLDGEINIDTFTWKKLDIKLAVEAMTLKGVALQSLSINSTEKTILAKATSEDLTAVLELKGEANDRGWRGRVERANLNSQQFNNWLLKAPTGLQIGADTIEIKPLCFESQSSNICLEAQKQNNNWHAMLNLKQVSLSLLSPWLPADMKLEGVANAKADIQSQAGRTTGEANVQFPSGIVSYPLLEGERDRWEYRNGVVTISLAENGISTKSEITMSNGDAFRLKAELPGAQLFSIDQQRQPLSAEGQLTIRDLGIIEAIIPEVQNPQGEVAVNIAADGTLAQPNFSGRVVLANGGFSIPRLGLKVEQLKVTGQSDSIDKLHFQLDAHSGGGKLSVKGQTILDRNAGWQTEISIKGKTFEVAHIPEAQVLVSPDLQIKLVKNTIDINGDVHIPIAKLQPKDLTTAARVSHDVVIVSGEQATDKKWSITTRVRLTLGERVNFYGFGFEGRFGGSLLLVDEPGQLTKATGELSIPEGRYRAYGQRLDVENGRLLYTGGPLTNPGLNLRAVRHVNNVTAGLNVRGSLNQPQIELFSIPAMGQTDALSYLILGRPIENATGEEGAMLAKATLALGLSGSNKLVRSLTDQFGLDEMRVESSEGNEQASLVMGRYLSPKLYVSYGVGLIEAFNTFTVRYQLSDKWHLKGESGEYHGADLFYTIER